MRGWPRAAVSSASSLSAARGGGWVLYVRPSWSRGYRPLQTFAYEKDRVFKDLNRLIALVRNDFKYHAEISLFAAGDEALRRYTTLLPADREALAPGEDETFANGHGHDLPSSSEDSFM